MYNPQPVPIHVQRDYFKGQTTTEVSCPGGCGRQTTCVEGDTSDGACLPTFNGKPKVKRTYNGEEKKLNGKTWDERSKLIRSA